MERGILACDGDESARRVLASLLVCVVTKATQSARVRLVLSHPKYQLSVSLSVSLASGEPDERARSATGMVACA